MRTVRICAVAAVALSVSTPGEAYARGVFAVAQTPDTTSSEGGSVLPLAVGMWTAVYLFNPIILYQDDHVDAGWTKELSVGFGSFGEHRLSAEYSLIFRGSRRHHLRAGYKYDFLLKDISPSNMLQTSSVITVGGGYFTDFTAKGAFAEVAYGYSIRNDKLLIYPHLKLQVASAGSGSQALAFSFGLEIGIANPFIDLGIRRTQP